MTKTELIDHVIVNLNNVTVSGMENMGKILDSCQALVALKQLIAKEEEAVADSVKMAADSKETVKPAPKKETKPAAAKN